MQETQDFAKVDLETHVLRQQYMSRMLENFGCGELHRGQLPLLAVLNREKMSTQAELAQLLHISPASVAVSLRRLEAGGYVRRLPVPGNLRANRVELTERGERAAQYAHEILLETANRMFDGFTPEECRQMTLFYCRMRDNLKRIIHSNEEKEESI